MGVQNRLTSRKLANKNEIINLDKQADLFLARINSEAELGKFEITFELTNKQLGIKILQKLKKARYNFASLATKNKSSKIYLIKAYWGPSKNKSSMYNMKPDEWLSDMKVKGYKVNSTMF